MAMMLTMPMMILMMMVMITILLTMLQLIKGNANTSFLYLCFEFRWQRAVG